MCVNRLFLKITSKNYPIKICIYNEFGNLIFQSIIYNNLQLLLSTKSKKIVIALVFREQTQFKCINLLCQRCFVWNYQPIKIYLNDITALQSFSLTDENYGIPITAKLYFNRINS